MALKAPEQGSTLFGAPERTILTVESVVFMALYIRESLFREPALHALPILERLATMTVICWVFALLRAAPLPRVRSR